MAALRRRRLITLVAAGLPLLSAFGCVMRVGPKKIRGDHFDYATAIANSWKSQMMLNLVRFRYMDPPVFMDVAQVITQYTFEASGSIGTPDWNGVLGPNAAVGGRWAESPTITYNPMTGDKLTRSLLTPVSPVSLLQLVQSGWPVEAVFGIAVKGINGRRALSNMQMMRGQGDREFYRVIKLLGELQQTNAFSIRVQVPKPGVEAPSVEFTRRSPDPASLERAREVKEILGLDQQETHFDIAFGAVQTSDKEIAMITRSIIEIIGETAAGVEVPERHLKEGRAAQMLAPVAGGEQLPVFGVKVHSSASKPSPNVAFVAAEYSGYWFWIGHRDLPSKRGLSFLLTLFLLAESGPSISPPVLTISKP